MDALRVAHPALVAEFRSEASDLHRLDTRTRPVSSGRPGFSVAVCRATALSLAEVARMAHGW